MMRLSEPYKKAIRDTVERIAPGAQVYLFGSRTDDAKKGGDIDLLVLTEDGKASDIRGAIWIELQKSLGEQKIDIVVAPRDSTDEFVRYILPEALEVA